MSLKKKSKQKHKFNNAHKDKYNHKHKHEHILKYISKAGMYKPGYKPKQKLVAFIFLRRCVFSVNLSNEKASASLVPRPSLLAHTTWREIS